MAKDIEKLIVLGPSVVGVHAPLEMLSNNASTCNAIMQDLGSVTYCLGLIGATELESMSSLDQKRIGDANALLREAAVRVENALETLREMEATRDDT